jgi:4-hydroxyacetophenone monooxygenase
MVLQGGHRGLDCRRDVHDEYVERINEANRQRSWGVSTVNTWYKNDRGHVTQNWPFNLVEYWQQTREPDPADYVFL